MDCVWNAELFSSTAGSTDRQPGYLVITDQYLGLLWSCPSGQQCVKATLH
jgi:hypothetical protein